MKVMLWGAGGNSKIFLKMLEENFSGNFEVTGIFEKQNYQFSKPKKSYTNL